MEKDLLAKLEAGGMQVNEADKAAFVKASASIYEEFGTDVDGGKALVDQALSLAN
jgi:TRAP-type C4-dicarboxylate transport system substrate-binding protein